MKITPQQLKQIIKEEYDSIHTELSNDAANSSPNEDMMEAVSKEIERFLMNSGLEDMIVELGNVLVTTNSMQKDPAKLADMGYEILQEAGLVLPDSRKFIQALETIKQNRDGYDEGEWDWEI